jgi:branched-chain amino acid transport system ATP-binding protein
MTESDSRNPSRKPLLSIEGVSVEYGRVLGLRPTTLQLEQGEMALVLGPNGAGKTSLLTAIAGLVNASRGIIRIGGSDIKRVPAHRRVKLGVSLVPEGRGTLPGLTVADNLDLGWRAGPRESSDSRESHLAGVFELFPVLEKRLRQDCSTLSGGEMQMLAIGRAILARPKLLLLDEPSLGLAPAAAATVHTALKHLSDEGLTMVLVEQKALSIEWTPDLTVVLRHGEIVFSAEHARPSEERLAELYLGHAAKTARA